MVNYFGPKNEKMNFASLNTKHKTKLVDLAGHNIPKYF